MVFMEMLLKFSKFFGMIEGFVVNNDIEIWG